MHTSTSEQEAPAATPWHVPEVQGDQQGRKGGAQELKGFAAYKATSGAAKKAPTPVKALPVVAGVGAAGAVAARKRRQHDDGARRVARETSVMTPGPTPRSGPQGRAAAAASASASRRLPGASASVCGRHCMPTAKRRSVRSIPSTMPVGRRRVTRSRAPTRRTP